MPSIHWNPILPVTVTTLLLVTISCRLAVSFPLNLTQTDLASLDGPSPPPVGSITSMTGVLKSRGDNNQATLTRETFLSPPNQSNNLPTNQVVANSPVAPQVRETMMIPPPPSPPSHQLSSNLGSVQYAPAPKVRDRVYGRNFSEVLAPLNSGIRDSERTFEGSGQGPPPKQDGKNERPKLDDTEDSDDDSDDEDYDDREPLETGSGHSHNTLHTTSKPDLNPNRSDTIMKPTPSDFYNPFRPPVTTATNNNNGNQQNQAWPDKTIASLPATTPSPASSQVVVSRDPTISPAMPSTTIKPILGSTTAQITVAPTARVVPPVMRNKTETDYDYEDESDDDEPEDTSVFEDNDPSEGDRFAANRTTISQFTTPSPISINRLNTTTKFDVLATSKVNMSAATLPIRPNNQPPAPTPRFEPIRPKEQLPTQAPSKPVINSENKATASNQGNVNGDDDEEEEEEGDEEEEEEEEEEDGVGGTVEGEGVDDEGVDEDSGPPSVSRRPEVPRKPTDSNQNSQMNKVVSMVTTTTQPASSRVHATQPTTTTPASSQYSYSKPREYITTSAPNNIIVANPERTNPVPIFPLIQQATAGVPSSNVPANQPSRPQIQNSGVNTITPTRLPPISPPRSQLPPLSSSSSSPINPMQFPTTPAPRLVPGVNGVYSTTTSYPTGRIAPSIVSTNNLNNLSTTKTTTTTTMSTTNYHDDSLTRQIYDKAVEAYHEADKAIRSALEAVWPPNIHLDQSSLEPWLAQPIFFMLALGGAIIGLVLLMLLIVYMVTYQGQPKEDDDDISIY